MPSWNTEQYLQFKKQRTQPAVDLIRRIPLSRPAAVLDLGCGPGNSTQALKDRFPDADIWGIDSSEEMLKTAKENVPQATFLSFDATDDLKKLGKKFDLIFSNACIQWIPDHPALFRNMANILKEDGILAVQTPMTADMPMHKILRETALQPEWREKIANPRTFYNLSPEGYFDLMQELFPFSELWQTEYFHEMPSHNAILEWYKGTGLRPYLEALNETDKEKFQKEIYQKITEAYPPQKNGTILFRFPRLFLLAGYRPLI